jgi:PPOX class probable F420-dependent enzyme
VFPAALVDRILDTAPVGRLAQIDDRGAAQALPFVFARVAGALWSPVDGKPKRHARLRRLAWIAEHPEVCVLIDHYGEDWSQLWWLKLYCRAEVHHDGHPVWPRAANALRDKYAQYAQTPLFAGEPTMIRLQWRDWRSWSAGGAGVVEAWLQREAAARR